MTNKNSERSDSEKIIEYGWAIGLIVFIFIVIYGIVISIPIDFFDKSGVFGDSFGVLTSLFSGLAFVGMIVAILLQRKDLQLQQKELRLTREQMKSQSFEATFFQMLRLHNDIVNSIDIQYDEEAPTTGRDCFMNFLPRLEEIYKKNYKNDLNILRYINDSYKKFWEINLVQSNLGHYFRFLYRLFKFVKENKIENKTNFSGIIRSQLSDQELLLLFYNCLSEHGSEKFKPIAEEFALFDNLPPKLLFDQSHIILYKKSAWGDDEKTLRKYDEEMDKANPSMNDNKTD